MACHNKQWETMDASNPDLPEPLLRMIVEHEISPREMDVALYDRVVHSAAYEPHAGSRIVALSQSKMRYPAGSDLCPTVTPGSRLALLSRPEPRFVVGQERLALRGFWPDMATGGSAADATKVFTERQFTRISIFIRVGGSKLSQQNNRCSVCAGGGVKDSNLSNHHARQFSDLAGNAFSGNHVAVAAIISLSIFEFPVSVADVEHLRTEARAPRRLPLRDRVSS